MIDGWVSASTLAISHDGGATFAQPFDYLVRYPVTPWTNSFSCDKQHPTLYGDFGGTNFIAKDGYYFKFFGYHSEPHVQPHQFGDCMMRTRDLGDASSWEIWTGSSFTKSKTEPCALIPNLTNAQSMTYNTFLNMYVATMPNGHGFAFSVSHNLIDWSAPEEINGIDTADTAYPSLLDPKDTTRNFERSGRTPYVYFTKLHFRYDRDLLRVQIRFARTLADEAK
jgi:hypothetical protein